MNFFLRPAQLEDAAALHQTCWPEREPPACLNFLERCQLRWVLSKRGAMVIAEVKKQPIGFGLLTSWGLRGEISDLIVTPAYRGRGIGGAMIDYLSAEAIRLRMRQLEIGAAERNPRAKALYERLGFAPQRRIEINLGAGLEWVDYLVKPLPQKR